MIRIYDKNEKDFQHNGYGILKDVLTCTCTEVLNGQYDIELEYPVNGTLIEYITEEKHHKSTSRKFKWRGPTLQDQTYIKATKENKSVRHAHLL